MFKRVFLFLVTNIMIMVMLGIVLSITGVSRYLTAGYNLDLAKLFMYSLIVGFMGSFISLLMSKWMAKFTMGIKVINPGNVNNNREFWLLNKVYEYANNAGLKTMPEVGIYDSPELNAFATGPSKNNSLVAVSTGLLQSMDDSAIEGVLGHEVAHIANGDMVTMTLIQGIVNTFVVFIAKIIAWGAAKFMASDDEEPSMMVEMVVSIVMQIILGILGSIVVMAFSRHREYKADKGGANIAGRAEMIHALESLKRAYEPIDGRGAELATMKISNKNGVFKWFSTHPDLDDRIEKLKSEW